MSDLLRELQGALNKVDGNVMNYHIPNYDEYYCTCCKRRVTEDAYNHKQRVCYKCWFDETEDLNDNS